MRLQLLTSSPEVEVYVTFLFMLRITLQYMFLFVNVWLTQLQKVYDQFKVC